MDEGFAQGYQQLGWAPANRATIKRGEVELSVPTNMGFQPSKKPKPAFVPTVTEETVPGECIGIIGVSRPLKKTFRRSS